MEFKLKPCPFCGSEEAPEVDTKASIMGLEEDDDNYDWYSTHYSVVCSAWMGGCGASTGGSPSTPEEAAELWNTRAES